MRFPPDVRERALVASARHCCVCRRYRGLKLEVHHIIPQSEGGSNDWENAIVLCFDCHLEAGHYNEKHPRGSKYTAGELRLARETWYERVRAGGIDEPSEPQALHCRYIIGKNFEFLSEIAVSEMKHFPLKNTLLVRTSPLNFLSELFRRYQHPQRFGEITGDIFPDEQAYLKARPEATRISRGRPGLTYFSYERVPSTEELYARVAQGDGITRLLLNSGVHPKLIARAVASHDACGGSFPEEYCLRPLWGVFLAITNKSSTTLRLESVEGVVTGADFDDLELLTSIHKGEVERIRLPAAPIEPDATVLVPIATTLGPLYHVPYTAGYEESVEIEHFSRLQTLTHVTQAGDRAGSSYAWGPVILPQNIRFSTGGSSASQSVHPLDLDNVYEIDRHWMMGSCPHAFAVLDTGAATYLGEVIPQGQCKWALTKLTLPRGTRRVIICELEDEITILKRIECGSDVVCVDHILKTGEYIDFVPGTEDVEIQGMYIPRGDSPWNERHAVRRNALVSNFLPVINSLPPCAITAVIAAD